MTSNLRFLTRKEKGELPVKRLLMLATALRRRSMYLTLVLTTIALLFVLRLAGSCTRVYRLSTATFFRHHHHAPESRPYHLLDA